MLFFININFNRPSCKQTVEKPIRHCSLRRLILACTMCLCRTKRTLVLYGLNTFVVYVTHISCIVSSSNWIMIGYRAGLTIYIGMAFAICGTEPVTIRKIGAQCLSGRVLDWRPRGCWFEPHLHHCVVVLEQDTFILAYYWFNPGRPVRV